MVLLPLKLISSQSGKVLKVLSSQPVPLIARREPSITLAATYGERVEEAVTVAPLEARATLAFAAVTSNCPLL